MAPSISVIIPSYNHRQFIGEALASVRAQTCPPLELIVIDDGSTDGSAEYLRNDAAITHLTVRENRGAHATLNEAIARAGGSWISILNSDDVYAPDRLARLHEFAAREGHDLVFSDVAFIDANGPLPDGHKTVRAHDGAKADAARDGIAQALLRGNFTLTSSNLMFQKALFQSLGPFRAFRYCHDWDFLVRAIGRARLGWLRAPLVNYRQHDASTMGDADRWRYLTEKSLLYALFFADGGGAPGAAMQSSDYVFAGYEFSPIVVSWLLSECRRAGAATLLAELEAGTLHHRVRAAVEPHLAIADAERSVRRLAKRFKGRFFRKLFERPRGRMP